MEAEWLFDPGQVVATPGAMALIENWEQHYPQEVWTGLLRRHLTGDWGDVCEEDAKENEFSVENGLRILSSYKLGDDKVWLITEADRSVTTFLLPEGY